MSYRCQICNDHVPHGQHRRIWNLYRKDKSILREIAVCDECLDDLKGGLDPGMLAEEFRQGHHRDKGLVPTFPSLSLNPKVPLPKAVEVEAIDDREVGRNRDASLPIGKEEKGPKKKAKPHPRRRKEQSGT